MGVIWGTILVSPHLKHEKAALVANGFNSEVLTTKPSTDIKRCKFLLDTSRKGTWSGSDLILTWISFLIDSVYSEFEDNDKFSVDKQWPRLDDGMGKNGVYVSHDVIDNGELFEDFCKSFFNSNLRIALHVKEIKVIEEVVRLLKKYSLENYFLFNTENHDLTNISNDDKV